ncbi:MAG TPA: DNA repair protein RecN [Limnochordia bacterium]|nr:DNA repair protein RecN [Limnochordia bacterium]HQD70190.1 DNA repair protein RecN [Limnochordia bacterium]
MLKELQIRDFALIEQVHLSFYEGFSVLTGETGAGKSIIIDALSLLLGARASLEMIRTGCERAVVEGVFSIPQPVCPLLAEWGIGIDSELIITREIHRSGRNRCWLNGSLVTVNQLSQLGRALVDILGQHDHQSLLDVSRHLDMLDAFGGAELQDLRRLVADRHQKYIEIKRERERLQNQERERLARIDLLQFQINEIDQAKLRVGEEAELVQQQQRLANIERITTTAESVYARLQEHTDQPPLYDQLAQAVTELSSLTRYDSKIAPVLELFNQALIQLEEGSRDLRQYLEEFDRDPEALEQIENRLALLRTLKRKYGESEAAILAYADQIRQELEVLLESEITIEKLKTEEEAINRELAGLAGELRQKRRHYAKILQQQIEKHLADLNMEGTRFEVRITDQPLNETGIDAVEFMIAPNVGEELKPLAKIASGGEMSRVMLALKNCLVEIDRIPALVFDEVDSGIGGRTARSVAQKLRHLSRQFQVFVVTHLPVVASFAEHHYYVEKHEKDGRTSVSVTLLDEQERIDELVRMLGGQSGQEATAAHAKELLKQANTS